MITTEHEEDVRLIGEALLEAAKAGEFCHEFDDLIDSLNHELSVKLPTRRKKYRIAQTYTVTRILEIDVTREEAYAIAQNRDDLRWQQENVNEGVISDNYGIDEVF